MITRRYPLFWIDVVIGIAVLGLCFWAANEKASELIPSKNFRAMLDQETSKGLKVDAHYAPLRREGILGLATDSFQGDKGQKTIVSMDAHDIHGWFNPLGIGLRQWQLDDLHIKSGTVWLQKTEANPNEPKGPSPIPWWGLFWPYRVEIEDVKVDDADVLFNLKKKESGIYHTFLEITPNGRDFEYDGKGGVFKTPLTPELNLQHVHLLIRKPRLYCPTFILGVDADHPEQQIQVTGDAGLQDDQSIHIAMQIDSVRVAPFLPEKLRDHVLGHMNGHLDYHSTGTGLETAEGKGSVDLAGLVIHELPLLKQYVKTTGSPDPGDLHLQVCRSDLRWEQGAIIAENLKVECPGVFKLSGTVTIAKDKTLSGELHLGLTDTYIKWLPRAKKTIFTEKDGAYFTTTIHVSGTTAKPHQDLSARVLKQISESPTTAVKLFFNSL
jgi:hypothetical protein